MYVYSGHALSYTKLVHRHATQTEGNKSRPNLDTQFCVEVFVEFYIYMPTPRQFQFF